MSMQLALRTLTSLGLTEVDAQVYIFLAKKGKLKKSEIAKTYSITKCELNAILEHLTKLGMAVTFEGSFYSAIPLERVLDEYVAKSKEQAESLLANRDKILSTWRALNIDGS